MTTLDLDAIRAEVAEAHRVAADPTRSAMHVLADLGRCLPDLLAEVERLRAILDEIRVELRDARNDLLDVRGILAPNGQPDVTPVSLVPTVAPAVAWLVAEVERYQPAVIGSTNIGTPIVLWMHACGFAESFGDDWRPEDGGCDACESGSNNPDDWQPLYVRRGES